MSKTLISCVCFGLLFSSWAVSKKPEHPVLLLEGKDFHFYFRQGAVFLSAGDYTQAIENFSKTLSLNPKLARAMNLRGVAYFPLKNYRLAEDQLNQALALDYSYGGDEHGGYLFYLCQDLCPEGRCRENARRLDQSTAGGLSQLAED